MHQLIYDIDGEEVSVMVERESSSTRYTTAPVRRELAEGFAAMIERSYPAEGYGTRTVMKPDGWRRFRVFISHANSCD